VNIYVLIVVAGVYGGKVVTFHDFHGIEACEKARSFVTQGWAVNATCLPKGKS
jgi:hypothetical protein